MITAVIVDDVQPLGNELKRMVEAIDANIKVAAVCCNTKEAEIALNKYHPSLVFLDVELENNLTSFDLLNKVSPIDFEIIFTTAHNRYAIQAIKFSAIDYLLKPLDKDEIKIAIDKVKNKKNKLGAGNVESLLAAWENPGNQQNKIHLSTKTGYDLIMVSDIIYCEAINNECQVVLNNNKSIIVNMTLKQCEDILYLYRFFRIHKSYLINLDHLKKYIKGKDGTAVLSNEANLTVSRNFKDKFIQRLKKMQS